MDIPDFLQVQPDGIVLRLKVQPRSSKNAFGEPLGGELRIKVTAPPVDSAANEAVVRFLSETLDWPRNKIELIRGHTSRHKIVKLYGITSELMLSKLGMLA